MFVKTLIVSDINVYDVNDKFLESGIYYFIIRDFVRGKNIVGDLLYKNNKIQYEFRYFSFMMMLIKAQSYLARRINIELLPTELLITNSMPDNPSPKKSIEKKKPRTTYVKKKNWHKSSSKARLELSTRPFDCKLCRASIEHGFNP